MSEHLANLRKELKYEKTNQCVQCGYCLPVCPTYATMGKETHSPRGRINLVKMVCEGKVTDLSVLEEPMNLCLGCRACETACPTEVPYGEILEAARAAITRRKKFSFPIQILRDTLFKRVFPNRKIMNLIGHAMWFYETTGVQKMFRKTAMMEKLPYRLGQFEKLMPPAVSPTERAHLPKVVPAKGVANYKVAFFAGCVMDAMFRRINELSVRLLSEAGCEVHMIEKQTCCGALHAHAGEWEQSVALAKKNIAAFEQEEVDFIVNNAGGCGAMLKEYDHLLSNEPEWFDRAKRFADKSMDISQVLVLSGGIEAKTIPADRVTYQRSCHMTNVQKVTKEPLQLIQSVPNVELVELEDPQMCCGSAGIYNIVNYDASMEILDKKMENTVATKASMIITTNPGCLLQMKLGIEREKLQDKMEAVHLVEYLAIAAGILPNDKTSS